MGGTVTHNTSRSHTFHRWYTRPVFFVADVNRAARLLNRIPKQVTVVVESGFKDHEELMKYKSLGISAFLVGTTLMKAEDVTNKIQELLKGRGRNA